MSIVKKQFGTIDGNEIYSYTMDNGKGLVAEILTQGGTIRSLIFNGVDVCLGCETAPEYKGHPTYFGALIGRHANRIEDSQFELNGKVYKLNANKPNNMNLHGGICGFSDKIWDAEPIDEAEPKLVLTTFSPDGEEGFPGNMNVKVTYTLTAENSIKIHYECDCDADTVCNMTNHIYINLNGHDSGDMKNHTMQLNCSLYTPMSDNFVPYGAIFPVSGTPFDFTSPKKIGAEINADHPQVQMANGYDHNFVIDGSGYRKFAEVEGDKSHIVMEGFTDQPGVQLYTGNFLEGDAGKGGAVYNIHQSFCLETQVFPNSMKYPFYPSPILRKGVKYDTTTEYKFSQRK